LLVLCKQKTQGPREQKTQAQMEPDDEGRKNRSQGDKQAGHYQEKRATSD
jgi:hypothetical protein